MVVTLTQARAHLRLPEPLDEGGSPPIVESPPVAPTPPVSDPVDLQLKLDAATAIVLDYCTAYSAEVTAAWTPESAPTPVQIAVLTLLAELWRFRGDDEHAQPGQARGCLSLAVTSLLARFHDPVLA